MTDSSFLKHPPSHKRSLRKSDTPFWPKYKDIAILVLGATFGIMTSILAASQQARFLRDQTLFEKRFAVLRELVEVNNESWRKIDADFESVADEIGKQSEQLEKAGVDEKRIEKAIEDVSIDSFVKTLNADMRDYDSKMEMLTTLIAYIANMEPVKLKLDMEFSQQAPKMDALVTAAKADIERDNSPVNRKKALKAFLDGVKTLLSEARQTLKQERGRVNAEIKQLAASIFGH